MRQTHPSKNLSPFNAYMRYTYRSHSAAAPDASESSPGGLDEPPLARSSSGVEGSKSRRGICFPQCKRARSTQAQTSACAALRRPSVCDDRRSALSETHQKPSVSSLLRLRLVRLLFTNYQNLPSHLARTLRQYLLVTIESSLTDLLSFWTTFWLHPARSTRRVHSAWRVSCLVSVCTFFRSLSPSRTRSGSQTGSWVGMAYTNSCYRCLR